MPAEKKKATVICSILPSKINQETRELVQKTIEILKSDTFYRDALRDTIKAFHEALKERQTMRTMRAELDALKAELAALERFYYPEGHKKER